MRALSLLLVLVLAKLAVLAGHTVPWSFWTPVAYLWQDVLAALLFAALDLLVQKARVMNRLAWLIYWALALYAAINIPVGRAVSTPLTWPMLHAARGPLADSLLLYATFANVLLVLVTLLAAGLLPVLLRLVPRRQDSAARAPAPPRGSQQGMSPTRAGAPVRCGARPPSTSCAR